MLERALGIGRELAERIAGDHSGEPIVVAAKALGMKAAVLQRILLFLNPAIGQSVERVYDLAQLFDELVAGGGRAHGVDLAQGRRTRRRPVHAPAHWDDERRSARASSTPAPRRDVQRRDDQRSRFKTGGATHSAFTPPQLSRKWRPARSSTSTIQTSGSNLISRVKTRLDVGIRHRRRRGRG